MTTLLLLHLGGAACLFAVGLATHLPPAGPWKPTARRCALAALCWEVWAAALLAPALARRFPTLRRLCRKEASP